MSKQPAIYQLEGVKCKYPQSRHSVLHIDKLELSRGDIMFIIGASGVGKSTILETLGIMNHTLEASTKFIFNGETDLAALYKKNDTEMSAFRSKNLSFIFQSTNMFNHLSAFDNVIIPQLMQGKTRNQALADTKKFTREIIPDLNEDKNITQLSGGQRQRLAFVRAIATDFNVLLADEPTGNLDPTNASNLMDVLVKQITDLNKTAIIVSHDINLATTFGNKIVMINRREIQGENWKYGHISKDSLYTKQTNQWVDSGKKKFGNEQLAKILKEKLENQ